MIWDGFSLNFPKIFKETDLWDPGDPSRALGFQTGHDWARPSAPLGWVLCGGVRFHKPGSKPNLRVQSCLMKWHPSWNPLVFYDFAVFFALTSVFNGAYWYDTVQDYFIDKLCDWKPALCGASIFSIWTVVFGVLRELAQTTPKCTPYWQKTWSMTEKRQKMTNLKWQKNDKWQTQTTKNNKNLTNK